MLAEHSRTQGLRWSMLDVPHVTPFKKTHFCLPATINWK